MVSFSCLCLCKFYLYIFSFFVANILLAFLRFLLCLSGCKFDLMCGLREEEGF